MARYTAAAALLLSRAAAFSITPPKIAPPSTRLFMSGRSITQVVPGTKSNEIVTRLVGTVDVDGQGTLHPLDQVDPFILLDEGTIQKDHMPPFGAHPHRGHSVVTILMQGSVESWDSFSQTKTVLTGPASYWVDAGTGLFHDEFSVIKDESDPKQHVKLMQLWIGVKDEDRLKPPRVQHDENLPLMDLKDTDGNVIGKIRYHVGVGTSIETPHPITVAHVQQDANTIHHFPIPPSHGGFIVNLKDSSPPAFFGGTTPANASDVLVLSDTSGDFLEIQTQNASADYMIVVGERLKENWAKKLVASGAVIAASPQEARNIAEKVNGYAQAGKSEGGSFAPFGV